MIDLSSLLIVTLAAVIFGGAVALKLRKGDTYIVTHHSPTVNVSGKDGGGAGGIGFLIPLAKLAFTVILLVALFDAITGALNGIDQVAQSEQAAPAVATQAQPQVTPIVVSPVTYEPPFIERMFSEAVNGVALLGGLAAGVGALALMGFALWRGAQALGRSRASRSDPIGQIDDIVEQAERRMNREKV